MATDIDGLKPRNSKGQFFCPGTRWLNPLAKFLEEIEEERTQRLDTAPVYEDYDLWYTNNGGNLDDEGCLKLAKIVREALNTGAAAHWAQKHGHPCMINDNGNTVYHIGSAHSLFSEQCVLHFAEFLENCGGFEVA